MASPIPTQERIVDPFASYNSNVVNKITEITTQGDNGLLTTNSLQVSLDSTSPLDTVVVSTGYAVKDDVLIHITAEHTVDFDDTDNYTGTPLMTTGYYYVVLDYTYSKSRPAPQASIKILTPTEISAGAYVSGGQFMILKVVEITVSGGYQIDALHDYDPSDSTKVREYLKYYAGTEPVVPTFSVSRDQSRMLYASELDKFYFGYSTGWAELSAGGVGVDINTDSTGVSYINSVVHSATPSLPADTAAGVLCYADENRDAVPAIATGKETGADLVVLTIGTAAAGTGRGSIAGYVENVPVENGVLIGIGDLLYLSDTGEGRVTNVQTFPVFQVVGRALSAGSYTTPIEMIFSPKVPLSLNIEGQVDTWIGPDSNGDYYHDINVTGLDGTNAYHCSWFDNSNHREIIPSAVQIRSEGSIVRVYISDSTTILDYVISSGQLGAAASGGGSGGGVSDHALLTSLDYASSGHTGFSPTSHTHSGYVDIPSGQTILFEADTAVSGYSLLTSLDDYTVYITKGSVAGGEAGGTSKSGGTWTQPSHSHTISTESTHAHTGPNHRHNTYSHTLTTSEMPQHRHVYQTGYNTLLSYINLNGNFGGGTPDDGSFRYWSEYTGSSGSHTHGYTYYEGTGATGSAGSHNHGGSAGSSATANTWRPQGRNFTRQQRT